MTATLGMQKPPLRTLSLGHDVHAFARLSPELHVKHVLWQEPEVVAEELPEDKLLPVPDTEMSLRPGSKAY